MTKVMHLITSLGPGGAQAMLLKLVSHRINQDLKHVVVSMHGLDDYGHQLRAAGVEVISLNIDRAERSFAGLCKFILILGRMRPDVLQCWMYHADLLGTVATRFFKVRKLILGIRCSDMDLSKYSRLTRWVVRLDAKLSFLADTIVVNSLSGMKVHQDLGYPADKMVFVPNGFDTGRFQPQPEAVRAVREELGLAPGDLLVGLFARYDVMKDHQTFFEAAALIAKQVPNIHFVLVGSKVTPDNPILQQFVKEQSLSGKAHLLGKREDISRLTAALDLAVSSSAFGEGFSNALGEAMASGIPCVATDTGDARKILENSGSVVPVRNPTVLASECIKLLLASPEVRAEIGRACRQRILEKYSLPKIIREFELLYE